MFDLKDENHHFDWRWKRKKLKLIDNMDQMSKLKKEEQYLKFKDLPSHIQVDILAMLPVKALIRFKTVSKAWFALIGEPSSMNAHEVVMPHNRIATRRVPASKIDSVLPTLREIHLLKQSSATHKLKLVGLGIFVKDHKLVEYCVLKPGSVGAVQESIWNLTNFDLVWAEYILYLRLRAIGFFNINHISP